MIDVLGLLTGSHERGRAGNKSRFWDSYESYLGVAGACPMTREQWMDRREILDEFRMTGSVVESL